MQKARQLPFARAPGAFNFETAGIDLAHALRLPRRSEETNDTKQYQGRE
jgi:hypothetical protein